MRPRQNGRHFADAIFKCIFLNENIWILIKISLKFVPKGPINNTPALVQIMAWRRPGDKPLSELMMVSLLMHTRIYILFGLNELRPYQMVNILYRTFSNAFIKWKCYLSMFRSWKKMLLFGFFLWGSTPVGFEIGTFFFFFSNLPVTKFEVLVRFKRIWTSLQYTTTSNTQIDANIHSGRLFKYYCFVYSSGHCRRWCSRMQVKIVAGSFFVHCKIAYFKAVTTE